MFRISLSVKKNELEPLQNIEEISKIIISTISSAKNCFFNTAIIFITLPIQMFDDKNMRK